MTTKIRYGLKELMKDLEIEEFTFAMVLKTHRECEELTQVEFARQLGLSRQNLCDLEKGRRIPSPERAAKIARQIGAMPERFIQLAVQDSLRNANLHYEVMLEPKKKSS